MVKDGAPEGRGSRRHEAVTVVAEAVGAGVAGLVHPALGILASGFVGLRQAGLLNRWLAVVDREFQNEGMDALDPTDVRTIAVFNRLALGATQTSRTEKLELLASALIGAVKSFDTTDDFLVEHFADLAVRLSPEHVRLLQILDNPEEYGIDLSTYFDDEHLIELLAPGATDDEHEDLQLVLEATWRDLLSTGLIDSRFGVVSGLIEGNAGEDGPSSETTLASARGQRFLRYLAVSKLP